MCLAKDIALATWNVPAFAQICAAVAGLTNRLNIFFVGPSTNKGNENNILKPAFEVLLIIGWPVPILRESLTCTFGSLCSKTKWCWLDWGNGLALASISTHCLSKGLRISWGHCGIVGKDYADSNYGNLTTMSHKLRTKPTWRHCGEEKNDLSPVK